MNPSSKGEETIFAEALRLPPEERAAYIAQATQGDAELRQEIESLLGSYNKLCFERQLIDHFRIVFELVDPA